MMSNIYLRLFIRFVFYLLFQVLVLDNIELSGLMNPYFYPLFILLLPLNFPQWANLLLAFAMGYSVGSFSNNAGLHAFASVFIAFIRPFIISTIFPQNDTDDLEELSIDKTGVLNFILYAFVLIFIHHFIFFILEVWSFTKFYFTFIKIFFSAIISTLLIILSEYLFWRKRSN